MKSLPDMERIKVPWALTPPTMTSIRRKLHVFCDASEAAIGYVAYLRAVSDQGEVHVVFVCSSSPVAPHSATMMPRLELCTTVKVAMSVIVIREELRVILT